MIIRHRRRLALGVAGSALAGPMLFLCGTAVSCPAWQETKAITPVTAEPDPVQVQADIDEINAIRKRIGSGIAARLDGLPQDDKEAAEQAFRDELDRLVREANSIVVGIQEPADPPGRVRSRRDDRRAAEPAESDRRGQTSDRQTDRPSPEAGRNAIQDQAAPNDRPRNPVRGNPPPNQYRGPAPQDRDRQPNPPGPPRGPGPDSDRLPPAREPVRPTPPGPDQFSPPQARGPAGRGELPRPPVGRGPGRRPGAGFVPPAVGFQHDNPDERRRRGLRHAARQLEQLAADLEEAGVFDQADELRHRAGDFWRMAR